jgi:conjugative relaxase-like TrwC/TraI family protein
MLRIHTARSAEGVKKYFEAADYYSQGNETVGRWGGKLAAELGLSGTVDKASFEMMCDNINAATGKSLTPRNKENRRVGEDMVFSLMKDVGAFIMLLPPEQREALLAMVEARVEHVMSVIEADVQSRIRMDGMDADRTTGNFAYAGFRHTTARPVKNKPPDPHPHWHMFAFNATKDAEEGRIKAAQMADIFRDRSYYEALFLSLVAGDFREKGFALERRANGKWGMAGLDSFNGTFSKRTNEIEEEARRLNITHQGRKAQLGAKTRSKKNKELTPEELHADWFGQLTDDQRDAFGRACRKEFAQSREVTAREAADFAVEHCFEQYSVVPERELLRVALLHGMGCVSEEQILRELPRHGVFVQELDGRRMATTEALQAEEDDIARFADRGRFSTAPIGVASGLNRTMANGKRLSAEQWAVVTGLLDSEDRVNVVEGPAGAGKSSLLSKFDEGMKLKGRTVTYLGTTAKAAEVLQDDGFDAHTVQRFLVDPKMQAAAVAGGGDIVCDEASMLGHKDAHKLFRLAEEHGLRLTFVGDPRQHGSVPRGAFLHVLKTYGHITPLKVTKIIRQEDPEHRAAAQLFADGKTAEGLDAMDRLGLVREMDMGDIARHAAEDYMQAMADGASCVVVSPTHAEANAVTDAIRAELRAAGKLGKAEKEFSRLVQVNASEAERKHAFTYRPGDVLVFQQNAKGGFTKGDRLTVTDPALVPIEHADKFSLYRSENTGLAVGDRIRFIGRVEAKGGGKTYRNGSTGIVSGYTDAGNIRLEDGHVIDADAGLFRHGYVSTTFGAQGCTAKRAILAMSSRSLAAINMEALYVAATRAKQWARLYTDDKDAVRRQAGVSSRKMAALDLRPKELETAYDWPERLKDITDHRRRLDYCELAQAGSESRPGWNSTPPVPPSSHGEREWARQQERSYGYER